MTDRIQVGWQCRQSDSILRVTLLQSLLPEEIENHRDKTWHREPELRIDEALSAERFIERLGFCAAMTDARRPGPSLYVAVCGRRDAHMPRNVQKDPESSLTWTIKDEVARRGRVYYGKLRGNRSIFIARPLISSFNALFGIERRHEKSRLSEPAQAVLRVLRKEWEMATGDLRVASGVNERTDFARAIEELQRTFKVLPSEIVYAPKFTYIWSLAEGRFAEELTQKTARQTALTEIARAYLVGAGMTLRGELARVTGLSNPDAGLGNWALVDEGFARRTGPGIYQLDKMP
ncbi:MAG TPA: hypothetical protein VLL54_05585 [Pyrinomonadaceae bacterium]|nr:hypothetical protein [Pyrinomonadaceae bacterium]